MDRKGFMRGWAKNSQKQLFQFTFLLLFTALNACSPSFLNPFVATHHSERGDLGVVSQIRVESEDGFRGLAGSCLKLDVKPLDSNFSSASVDSDVELVLEGEGSFYSNSDCETEVSNVVFRTGVYSKEVFYKSDTAGVYSLSATLSGLETVNFDFTLGASHFFLDVGLGFALPEICKGIILSTRSSLNDVSEADLIEDVRVVPQTTSSGSGSFYSDSNCEATLSEPILFSQNENIRTLYYLSSSSETSALSVTAAGYTGNEVTFEVNDGSWKTPTQISSVVNTVTNFVLGGSYQTGHASAVWRQNDGANQSVFSNSFSHSSEWAGSPEIIENISSSNVASPWVAVDGNGNAVATMTSGSDRGVNEYLNGSWGGFSDLGSAEQTVYLTRVDAAGDGYALAAWSERGAGLKRVLYANVRNDSGWSVGREVASNETQDFVGDYDVVVNARGDAALVWSDTINNNVNAYYYSGGTWSDLGTIDASVEVVADVKVGMDALGNLIVVWKQESGGVFQLNANRYNRETLSWDASVTRLDSSSEKVNAFDFFFAPGGTGYVVWTQDAVTDGANVHYKEFRATSWEAETILDDWVTDAYFPVVAANDRGYVVAAWRQSDESRNAVRVTRRAGWSGQFGAPETLDNGIGGQNAGFQQVRMDAEGRIILGWIINNQVFARKFTPSH